MFAHNTRKVRGVTALFVTAAATFCLVLTSCSSGNSAAPSDGGNAAPVVNGSMKYGTDAYFTARTELYNKSNLFDGFVITKDELPWDPNGPKIKASEVSATLMYNLKPTAAQFSATQTESDQFQDRLMAICDGVIPYGADDSEFIDSMIIANLRLADQPVDVSGGVDCGNGKVLGGSGYPILSGDRSEQRTWTYDKVLKTLEPTATS